MSNSNKGLGRGFDSLLPQNFDETILVASDERIQQFSPSDLQPNPEQPRQVFDETNLKELADSIKEHGILQPLVVTPHANGYYIIAGERRWRAAQKAGLKKLPALVRSTEQLERLELALVENVQRVDLSPLEQARSIQYLKEQFSQGYDVIARRLGKAHTTVQNTARLLQLPKAAKQALRDKKISEGHARAILALKDEKLQEQLLGSILANGWSVRQAERFVVAHKQGAKSTSSIQKRVATTNPQTERLSERLKAPVNIRRTAKGGKLEIVFKNDADLKRIISKLGASR